MQKILNGITYVNYDTVYIDDSVQIGTGTLIEPNVYIRGKSKIGKNCKIYNGADICDSIIGDDTFIGQSALIRKGSIIGYKSIIGKSVELKNVKTGNNCGIYHLSFIGDAILGDNVSIGAGTVFANTNFEGKKFVSIIGNNVSIGVKSTIISPVKIGNDVQIGASSFINRDITENNLVFNKKELIIKKRG